MFKIIFAVISACSLSWAEEPKALSYELRTQVSIEKAGVISRGEGVSSIDQGSPVWFQAARMSSSEILLAKITKETGKLVRIEYLIVDPRLGKESTVQLEQITSLGKAGLMQSETRDQVGSKLSKIEVRSSVIEKENL